MPDLTTAALRYAHKGIPVFPCRPGAKEPAITNGLNAASTDITQVAQWWLTRSDFNIGMATGETSGIVVLDIDGDEGADSLFDLEKIHGELPSTTTIQTPSGGTHYYFKHPGSRVPNSVSKVGAKIDIRGDGGYVLAPPSFNAERGRSYEVDTRAAIAEMPSWLMETALGPNPGEVVAHESDVWLKFFNGGVGEGQRNHKMAQFAGYLLRRFVHLEVARELCHMVNRQHFKPPLPEWEVNQCVQSICDLERRRRNTKETR